MIVYFSGNDRSGQGYFSIEASENAHKTQKLRHGSKTKSNVIIMAENAIL